MTHKTKARYSVWRNADDRLMILDGTSSECAERIGITRHAFYVMINSGGNQVWTVRKATLEEIEAEQEETG